jgi:hypothetical protein
MAELVNLNRVRKDRARKAAEKTAAANRVVHGRTKAEKALAEARDEQRQRLLDGHRRNKDDIT